MASIHPQTHVYYPLDKKREYKRIAGELAKSLDKGIGISTLSEHALDKLVDDYKKLPLDKFAIKYSLFDHRKAVVKE